MTRRDGSPAHAAPDGAPARLVRCVGAPAAPVNSGGAFACDVRFATVTLRSRSGGTMPIVNRVADLAADIAAWRRDLHAHPEILYDVHRTAAVVAEKLSAFGCDEVVSGIGRSGVIGVIRGRKGVGKTIGLRADMDALPI